MSNLRNALFLPLTLVVLNASAQDATTKTSNLNGKVSRVSEVVHSADKTIGKAFNFTKTYLYDESGNRLQWYEDTTKEHYTGWQEICSYEDGLLVKVEKYSRGRQVPAKTLYTYNSDRQRTKADNYDHQGKLFEIETFSYDNHMRLSGLKREDVEKQTITSEQYTYDEHNNISEINYNSGPLTKVKKLYDGENRVVEEICHVKKGKGVKIDRFVYKYNSHGDIAERITYKDGKSFVTDYTYDLYDSHGNYMMQYIAINGESPSMQIRREIDYFPE